jgi:hypothetical protein
MINNLIAAASIALTLLVSAPAQAHGGWATWKCTANGIRYNRNAPVPQRVPFTGSGHQRVAAVGAALSACRASSKVKPGSCTLATCWVA